MIEICNGNVSRGIGYIIIVFRGLNIVDVISGIVGDVIYFILVIVIVCSSIIGC